MPIRPLALNLSDFPSCIKACEAALDVQKGWSTGWAKASVGARYAYNRVSPEGRTKLRRR